MVKLATLIAKVRALSIRVSCVLVVLLSFYCKLCTYCLQICSNHSRRGAAVCSKTTHYLLLLAQFGYGN